MADITLAVQLACARRELALRTQCYPRWVEQGRMPQARADHERAAMAAICATLAQLVEAEQGQLALLEEG